MEWLSGAAPQAVRPVEPVLVALSRHHRKNNERRLPDIFHPL
jgi:hypothetical protein